MSPRLRPFLAPLAAAALLAAGARAAEAGIPESPFKDASAGKGAAGVADEALEFAGVSQMGTTTHLVFHDKQAKKNRWIALGDTVEGISALRYDPRLEQAVVRVNGTEKTLSLRKGKGPVNSPVAVQPPAPVNGFAVAPPPPAAQVPQILPAPLPATDPGAQPVSIQPPKPAPAPGTPEFQVRQETEARMLVSDLLEIGMAQRRAYEEAQRRAAEGNTGNAAAPGQPPVTQK